MKHPAKKQRYDYTLLVVVLLLVGIGLILLYSTSAYNGRVKFHDSFYYLKKQGFATALGLAGMFIVAGIDYHRWIPFAKLGYVTAIVLSVAVMFIGDEYNGSKRWLSLGPISFQPSEFAKVAVILYLSCVISNQARKMEKFTTLVKVMLPVLPVVGLVGASNLSTAIIILGIAAALVFVASPKYAQFLGMGAAADWFQQADVTINIDHHSSNTYYGQYNYVEGASSSTSEIVYGFLEGNYPVDQNMAAGLYAGLIYDTGGFRHSSTSPNTMRVAGALMETGIPFTDIYNRFFDSRSFSEMKIMGQALENAKLYFDGKVVCATITSAEIAACNGTNKELDAIINYLKGVQGAEVACFLYEKTETEVKASFRGADGRDVCALAQKFGGGGHVKAAGCTIAASIDKAKEMVLAEIEKML